MSSDTETPPGSSKASASEAMTRQLASTSAAPGSRPATGRLIVGCGYLGSRVARRWIEAGNRVWAMTRSPARAAEFAAAGIEPIVADVTKPDTIRGLPDVATVFWAVGFDRTGGATYQIGRAHV